MEWMFSLVVGIGLSAACGFRVFVPMLIMSIAARTGHLELADSFAWIATTPALAAFSAATMLEIGGYYIPWLDNLLDALTTPCAVVAGIIASGAMVTELDPMLHWTLAVVAGGGSATLVQVGTGALRQASALTTAGLGNPIVSTAELGGSLLLSIFAILLPFLALALVMLLFYFSIKGLKKLLSKKNPPTAPVA